MYVPIWVLVELMARLGRPAAAIGIPVAESTTAASRAIELLVSRGCAAEIVPDIDEALETVFVKTDALLGAVLVFRPAAVRMPRPAKWS